MCDSLEKFGQQILSTSSGGQCTSSSDCLDMRCWFLKDLNIPNVPLNAHIHLHPCAMPPAISLKVTGPIGTLVNGTFQEGTTISGIAFGIPYNIMFGINQTSCGLAVMVRE